MRLIDADKLKEELWKQSVVTDDLFGMGIQRGYERAETAIDMMPTVDIKTEVAREIFEEIEKVIGESKFDEYSKETNECIRTFYNGTMLVKFLAELKNKYTKEGVDK